MSDAVSKDRLLKQGLLAELRDKHRRAANRAKGVIGSIGDATFLVDPGDPFLIDGQKVMDFARELYEVLAEGNKLKAQIEQLEADLGV